MKSQFHTKANKLWFLISSPYYLYIFRYYMFSRKETVSTTVLLCAVCELLKMQWSFHILSKWKFSPRTVTPLQTENQLLLLIRSISTMLLEQFSALLWHRYVRKALQLLISTQVNITIAHLEYLLTWDRQNMPLLEIWLYPNQKILHQNCNHKNKNSCGLYPFLSYISVSQKVEWNLPSGYRST